MTKPENFDAIDVVIEDDAWPKSGINEDLVKQAAAAALQQLDLTPGEGAVTVLLTTDDRVCGLNNQFRSKDDATNVLSFPSQDDEYVGDIALSFGTVTREAQEQGLEISSHVSHLVIHGVLHLIGYDHQTDTDAEKMEALEVAILSRLGIASPYEIMERPGTTGILG